MDSKQKDLIVQAAKEYMAQHSMTPAEFGRRAGVNPSYLSYINRGEYTFQNTEIKDAVFLKIAKAAGCSLARTYWDHVSTEQYREIMSKIREAHEHKYLNTIIAPTGYGKSYSVARYCAIHPTEVVLVTVNNTDDVHSIMLCMAQQLRITLPKRRGSKLRALADAFQKIALEGKSPLIVIDEAENMKGPGIKACKAIYDLVVAPKNCGMVLIGTEELPKNIDRFERYGMDGMAQFKRRIAAGITRLPEIDFSQEMDKFMEIAGITDPGLRALLLLHCRNYGVLHDYLERAIRLAQETEEPLTEDFFRTVYNLRKDR